MPGFPQVPRDVRTVHLGEFLMGHADLIAEQLDAHGIVWWSKEPGPLSKIWQLGVELFVDRDRLEEARELAKAVLNDASTTPRSGRSSANVANHPGRSDIRLETALRCEECRSV